MFTSIRLIAMTVALAHSSSAQETTPSVKNAAPVKWSLVYLPSLDWTDGESKQAVALLEQINPNMIVSLSAVPFGEALAKLRSKPVMLNTEARRKNGVACGLDMMPFSAYADGTTLHTFAGNTDEKPSLVWLSAKQSEALWNGPRALESELTTLLDMQVRKQFSERKGEVVFFVDPSVSSFDSTNWRMPFHGAKYEQAATAVTRYVCINPDSLPAEVSGIKGLSTRMPLVHWLHSGEKEWVMETLPLDGGPALQQKSAKQHSAKQDERKDVVLHVETPTETMAVPLWMDDYINDNQALGSSKSIDWHGTSRMFGWREMRAERDSFDMLRDAILEQRKAKIDVSQLARGAVRSPNNLFSVTVGQLTRDGFYSGEGDDSTNVYVDDLGGKESRYLYFAGLYDAWPMTATWFTDRYVMTAGSSQPVDYPTDTDTTPRVVPLTIKLFDLLHGKSYFTHANSAHERLSGPTERIDLPDETYEQALKWRALWKAVESAYRAKPKQSPVTFTEAATMAKLHVPAEAVWKDLGVWPPPETWRLAPQGRVKEFEDYEAKEVASGDPYIICKQAPNGQRLYTLKICNGNVTEAIGGLVKEDSIMSYADLFTAGTGCLRQVSEVQRMGDRKQFLRLSGTYQKAGETQSACGNWMLLLDLHDHRAWSSHW